MAESRGSSKIDTTARETLEGPTVERHLDVRSPRTESWAVRLPAERIRFLPIDERLAILDDLVETFGSWVRRSLRPLKTR